MSRQRASSSRASAVAPASHRPPRTDTREHPPRDTADCCGVAGRFKAFDRHVLNGQAACRFRLAFDLGTPLAVAPPRRDIGFVLIKGIIGRRKRVSDPTLTSTTEPCAGNWRPWLVSNDYSIKSFMNRDGSLFSAEVAPDREVRHGALSQEVVLCASASLWRFTLNDSSRRAPR